MKKNQIIGHRGFAGLRPENTLCGFSFAAEFGLSMVEFDVQLSKDEQWVLLHDDTLMRTTGMPGTVADYNLAELAKIDAGSWFVPPYPQQYIPSLQETVQLTNRLGLTCNIEVKNPNRDPKKHARLIADFIQQAFRPNDPQPIVSSFDFACLRALRRESPNVQIAYLIDEFAEDTLNICQEHHFISINCDVNKVTEANITQAKAESLPVYLYTVNDKATAERWINKGADGLFSDRPDLLL